MVIPFYPEFSETYHEYRFLESNGSFKILPYFPGLILLGFHQIHRRMNLELNRQQKMVSTEIFYKDKSIPVLVGSIVLLMLIK